MSWRPKSRAQRGRGSLRLAGGLIWVATPAADAAAAAVRAAVRMFGGHATLVRGSAALRAGLDVFEPQEAGLAALTKRVKEKLRIRAACSIRVACGRRFDATTAVGK